MTPGVSVLGINLLDFAVVCGIVLVVCLGIALGALRFLASLLPFVAGLPALCWAICSICRGWQPSRLPLPFSLASP
jgi:hypothetical protein